MGTVQQTSLVPRLQSAVSTSLLQGMVLNWHVPESDAQVGTSAQHCSPPPQPTPALSTDEHSKSVDRHVAPRSATHSFAGSVQHWELPLQSCVSSPTSQGSLDAMQLPPRSA